MIEHLVNHEAYNVISQTFKYMEVAERVIEEYSEKYPAKKAIFNKCFSALRPEPDMMGLLIEVYEAHCRELLDRVVESAYPDGRDPKNFHFGTDAELLVGFCTVSPKFPFNSAGLSAYYYLFKKIMGEEKAKRIFPDGEPKEDWPGQVKEMLSDMKRKIRHNRS